MSVAVDKDKAKIGQYIKIALISLRIECYPHDSKCENTGQGDTSSKNKCSPKVYNNLLDKKHEV